jgi:membrane-bound lytic murein transglycosylase D
VTARARHAAASLTMLLALHASAAFAQQTAKPPPPATRNGREIYARFHEGLADPSCDTDSSARWRSHFATAPNQLVSRKNDVLPLFAYVVDAVRTAGLPTEYALIPFVESGYQPGARSAGGPAGLWQMIAVTARDHHVPIRAGYDGRMSPVDSTRAAVRYLKTLHGMFAGDWRLAVMAYNAGEYRVFHALKSSGQLARSADPEKLVSLSGISQAYVRKLHALSCLLDQADNHDAWMQALDRPVPVLEAVVLPPDVTSLDAWSTRNGRDSDVVRRLNPAFAGGHVARADRAQRVLAPMAAAPALGAVTTTTADNDATTDIPSKVAVVPTIATLDPARRGRTHTVTHGESLRMIARHYQLRMGDLLSRNGLSAHSTLRPGMVLKLDGEDGK